VSDAAGGSDHNGQGAHVELLRGLVAVASVHPDEGAAVAYLCEQMARRGFRVRTDDAGNAIGEIGDGPLHVVMLGHIDTVPGAIPVRIEGDDLYGRGSVDAKGPLATFVAATSDAASSGRLAGLKVTVIGATGEEAHSPGANYLAQTMPAPDACIIGEPGGWESVVLGYKGSMQLRYVRWQPNAHGAGQEKPAPHHAVADWNAIEAYCESLNDGQVREFDRVTPVLRGFESHTDGLVQKAALTLTVRLPPRVSPQDVLQGIKKRQALLLNDEVGNVMSYQVMRGVLRETWRETDGEHFVWDEEAERWWDESMRQEPTTRVFLNSVEPPIPAYRCDKNTPLVRSLLAGVRATGGTAKFKTKTGTADMNVVGPAWKCQMAAYGPGDSAQDHTPHEHIGIAEYLRAVDALAAALGELGKAT